VVDLAHLDLLYANPIAAESLLEQAAADPVEYGWSVALANRYAEADTVGWLAEVLADPPVVEPEPEDPIVPDPELPGVRAGCECSSVGGPGAAWAAALGLLVARRRRR
jgi:MYXO-CTERM domain-containing protein